MPRFFPPHLMVLVTLLIVVTWFMLLHYVRQSASLQRFIAEMLGENTPEACLRDFQQAKRRLAEYLSHDTLSDRVRQEIELALGIESEHHGNQQSRSGNGSNDASSDGSRGEVVLSNRA